MAEGARDLWGLEEWDLARNSTLRKHLRYLAGFTPDQRRQAMSPAGLSFTAMPLAQQQRYLSLAFEHQERALGSLEELSGAVVRVDYTQPGWFEWRPPGPEWLKWTMPASLGPRPARALVAPVRERTREATLAAARRVDPQLRERVVSFARRSDPRIDSSQVEPHPDQIVATRLSLAVLYIPSISGQQGIYIVRPGQQWGTGRILPE